MASDTALADATVTVRHVQTGVERSVITNADGRFLLLLLQPGGPYELTATHLGYAELTLEGIQLQVGEMQTLELYLSQQAIEVAGIAVNVERAEIFNPGQVGPATLLNERFVESVPILGNLPGIGALFRKRLTIDKPRYLLIFVTATLLDENGSFVTYEQPGDERPTPVNLPKSLPAPGPTAFPMPPAPAKPPEG